MPALRIYGIARTRAFRAIWIAKELGLDFEHVPIEIGEAGARKADYLAGNPNGRLYPATPEGEAKTWQWSFWALNEVDRGVNIWSLHAVRLPPEDRNPEKLAAALAVIAKPFRVLDEALADRTYLLGDDFTVADLNVSAVISRAVDMDLSATPRLGAWLARCLERPAAREARRLRADADAASPADAIRMIAKINRL